MTMRIHLVRHALSEANLDLGVNRAMPDHAIALAAEGHEQAAKAGRILADHIAGVGPNAVGGMHRRRVRILNSPYKRTRQTAEHLEAAFAKMGLEHDRRENLQLREQQFGLFDGIPDDGLSARYPDHYAYYRKFSDFEGEFFAPMPMGESRAMVTDRVRGAFGTILRDMAEPAEGGGARITDMVVVSHGVTIRCFLAAWLHLPWEWCEKEPNPWNTSVTTLVGERGKGWKAVPTFEGFRHVRTNEQDRREEGHVA